MSPAGRDGWQSMPAAISSWTNGSSGHAGSTATVATAAPTAALEMLTPLPPACDVIASTRWTAPRSSGPGNATVRSKLGLAVSVTIDPSVVMIRP